MNLDLIQVAIAAIAAAVGFLARGRSPAPAPPPNPPPNQFPLLELILRLLAERFRVALPGAPLPQETLTHAAEPMWAQQLMAEVRNLKRT